ncbi:CheB methylesterase domain-containing protein [Sulfurimonas microaerophilic]|uniref:CheB methylesterase domain-containing protein n=1 Tax=Sulfurimonas microaerophilic TaxID=3058392 RepID=UPI0027152790|nr:CheB methylesterase domain-containing protein [Sulfurimonas sp. hsl 1-7]
MLIGASTGGPAHIEKILSSLEEPLPFSIVIAQHMGEEFLPSFVKRLSLKTNHKIMLCEDGQTFMQGCIYVATNNSSISSDIDGLKVRVKHSEKAHFNPEINHLFNSVNTLTSTHKILAILLTGIGDDGVEGCKLLSEHGAKCIAESEKTAIVYGMPARAKESVANIEVLDLDKIIEAIQIFGER